MHAKLRGALSRHDGADAIVMQSIVGEELAQGPYVAARVGFEPATLRTKDDESTNEPLSPTICSLPLSAYQKFIFLCDLAFTTI